MRSTLNAEPMLNNIAFYREWLDASVRHSDLDSNGHVNNTVFSVWFDDGRFEFLRRELRPMLLPHEILALANANVDFHREIAFTERPRVGTRVLLLGRSSITMGQGLFVSGGCAATAMSVTAIKDRNTGRARPLRDAERKALLDVFAVSEDKALTYSE